jgi:hypothetical protein
MGCATSDLETPTRPAEAVGQIEIYGQHPAHSLFVLIVQMDKHHRKWANVPVDYVHTPCPPENAVLKTYGVGSVFVGQSETLEVVKMKYPSDFISNAGGIKIVYKIEPRAAKNNMPCVSLTAKLVGPNMGLFSQAMQEQVSL